MLQRPVDLVEAGAVRNPFLLAGINQARELVYAVHTGPPGELQLAA